MSAMREINVRSSAIAENVRENTPARKRRLLDTVADWMLDNLGAVLVGVILGYAFGNYF